MYERLLEGTTSALPTAGSVHSNKPPPARLPHTPMIGFLGHIWNDRSRWIWYISCFLLFVYLFPPATYTPQMSGLTTREYSVPECSFHHSEQQN